MKRLHISLVRASLGALALLALACSPALAQTSPYPASSVVTGVSFDVAGLTTAAPGSDLWPVVWAADGNLYTVWGDGGGFGGTNGAGRVKLGVARLSGPATSYSATNVFGGVNPQAPATFDGKANGILSVGGVLYMTVVEQGAWLRAKIVRSTDNGRTWDFHSRGWDFAEPNGAFSDMTFLTFGQGYAGARDGYVYVYSQDDRALPDPTADIVWTPPISTTITMFRVPVGQIQNRSAYEYFAGMSGGNPIWTPNINQRQPVFSDPNGVDFGVRVMYNPGLDRYLLTANHNRSGGWGIFDAPEPWGPWTTVGYWDTWIDNGWKFGFTFNQKWLSADGKTAHMVFSGINHWDVFAVIRTTFSTGGGSADSDSLIGRNRP